MLFEKFSGPVERRKEERRLGSVDSDWLIRTASSLQESTLCTLVYVRRHTRNHSSSCRFRFHLANWAMIGCVGRACTVGCLRSVLRQLASGWVWNEKKYLHC